MWNILQHTIVNKKSFVFVLENQSLCQSDVTKMLNQFSGVSCEISFMVDNKNKKALETIKEAAERNKFCVTLFLYDSSDVANSKREISKHLEGSEIVFIEDYKNFTRRNVIFFNTIFLPKTGKRRFFTYNNNRFKEATRESSRSIAIWKLGYGIGGTEVSLIELANFFQSSGYEVFLYGDSQSRLKKFADLFSISIYEPETILTRNHDLIFIYSRLEDTQISNHIRTIPFRYGVFGGFVEGNINNLYDRAVAKTEQISDWLKSKSTIQDIKMTQFPIDLNYWKAIGRTEKLVPSVSYIGRADGKNLNDVIDIAGSIGKCTIDFVIADTQNKGCFLHKKCNTLKDATEFTKIHYQNADIFMMTSLVEGVPRAIMEAMAMSLPVVVYDIGGIKTLEASFTVDSKDKKQTRKILKSLIDSRDLRLEIGNNNRMAIEKFNSYACDYIKNWIENL